MKVNVLKKDHTIKKGSMLRILDVEYGGEIMALVIATDAGYQLLNIESCSSVPTDGGDDDIFSATLSLLSEVIKRNKLEILDVYSPEDFEINQIK